MAAMMDLTNALTRPPPTLRCYVLVINRNGGYQSSVDDHLSDVEEHTPDV